MFFAKAFLSSSSIPKLGDPALKPFILHALLLTFFLVSQTSGAVIIGSEKIAKDEESLFLIGLQESNLNSTIAMDQLYFDLTSLINLVNLNQYISAKQHINKSMLPQDLKYYFLGIVDLSKGDIDSAEEQFLNSIEQQPEAKYANYPLAAIKFERKQYNKALDLITTFNRTVESNVSPLMLQAHIEQRLSRSSEMINTLKRAINVAGADIAPTTALVKFYFRQGKKQNARLLIEEFIDANPNTPDGLRLAVSFHLSNNRPETAMKVLRDWLTKFPKDRIAHLQYVETLLNQKNFNHAEQAISQAINVFPSDNEFRYLNAILQIKLGDPKAAKSILLAIIHDEKSFLSKDKAEALLSTL